MIKVLIFDFDGVILESSEIKTIAFARMFENESEDIQKIMHTYHLCNMGFSRQRKFEYYFNSVLKKPILEGEIERMSERFRELVLDEILRAKFVLGMPEFLEYISMEYPLYIATGSPDDEIKMITKLRKISFFFEGIFGTPATKEEIIQNILSFGYRPTEAVLFGDAESDRISAQNTGIHFVGRIAHGAEMMGETRHKIKDFSDIKQIEDILKMLNS